MNKEEIKEILEDVKRHLDYVEATKQCSIRDNEMKAMYDYITNLQEENKHLDEVNCHLRKKMNNDIYKSRNEKAIEYIKNNWFSKNTRNIDELHSLGDWRLDLLNILKGEE